MSQEEKKQVEGLIEDIERRLWSKIGRYLLAHLGALILAVVTVTGMWWGLVGRVAANELAQSKTDQTLGHSDAGARALATEVAGMRAEISYLRQDVTEIKQSLSMRRVNQ